jgi:hypothetical protein
MLIVDADERIADATPDALDWLSRLAIQDDAPLPNSLRGLVRQTRAQSLGPTPLRPAKVRVRSPAGTWLVARAARFTTDATRTAVQMKAATRADMRGLLLAVHGLTPRERDVTELSTDGAAGTAADR